MILHALSEVKIKELSALEYQKAYTDALSSNDSYKLALMACTALNLNKKVDSDALIAKMVANIDNFGLEELPIENTITRSYGNDRKTETIAF